MATAVPISTLLEQGTPCYPCEQVNVPMVSKVEKVVEIPQVQYVDKVVPIPVQKQARTPRHLQNHGCAVESPWHPLASLGIPWP